MSDAQSIATSSFPPSPTHNGVNRSPSIDMAPIRTSADYGRDSEDEGDDAAWPPPSRGSHRSTPSVYKLLPHSPTIVPPSPVIGVDAERQERLRGYRVDLQESLEDATTTGLQRYLLGPKRFLKRNEGFLLIVLSQAFFAAINTCVKILQDRVAIPVWEIIVVRMSITWLGCYGYMRFANVEHPLFGPPGVRFLLCTRGVVGFFGLFGVYFSLQYLSLSDATVLSFLSPVLVGILAALLLKEPYSRLEAFSSLLSLFGTLLIAKPTFLFGSMKADDTGPGGVPVTPKQRTLAVLVALSGVFGSAGAYLCIRVIGKRANALHSISYFSAYCVIVSSLYPFFFDAPPVLILDKQFLLLMLPIGIFGYIAQALLTLGLQREKAGRGSLAVYSSLLYSLVFERIIFGRFPDPWSLCGSLIIMGGAIAVVVEKKSPIRKTASVEQKAEEGRAPSESLDTVLPGVGGTGER